MKTKTYTVLGDSIPKGITTKNNKLCIAKNNIVEILENYYNIKINNCSVYGQTLKRIYDKKLLQQIVNNMKKENSNYIIFSIGGNDADYNWADVSKETINNILPKTPINQFKKILQKSISYLKRNNINVLITTMIPMDSNRYFNNVILKQGNKEDILKFLKQDLSNITRQHERYNMALIEVAIANNCPILDIRTQLLLNKDYLQFLCEDGIHPNEKGYKKIANYKIKLTKKLFKNKQENELDFLEDEFLVK